MPISCTQGGGATPSPPSAIRQSTSASTTPPTGEKVQAWLPVGPGKRISRPLLHNAVSTVLASIVLPSSATEKANRRRNTKSATPSRRRAALCSPRPAAWTWTCCARGRFDRGVLPAGTDPTQRSGFLVAALYTPPGSASDPPPHHRPVLLAPDGQGHYPDGQGLPAVLAGQSSQTHTPATNRDTSTSPPFRPPPCRPGRAAAVHYHRLDIEMAGGHPAHLHHRRRLRQGPLRRLGVTLRSASHHHVRQRSPIHVRPLGGPVQPAQHPALSHDSIPPSEKWVGRVVPQAAEGRLAVPGRRRRLARPPPLGAAGYQIRLPGGQRVFTGRGGVRLTAGSSWTVHQHR
jgi:hypothetical protein